MRGEFARRAAQAAAGDQVEPAIGIDVRWQAASADSDAARSGDGLSGAGAIAGSAARGVVHRCGCGGAARAGDAAGTGGAGLAGREGAGAASDASAAFAAAALAMRVAAAGVATVCAPASAGRNASMRSRLISKPARGLGASGRSRRPFSAIWYQSCTTSGRRRAASASTSTPSASISHRRHQLLHLHAMQAVGQCVEHAAPVRREFGERGDFAEQAFAVAVGQRIEQGADAGAVDRAEHRRHAPHRRARRRRRWRRCRRSPGRAATGRRAGCRRRPCDSWRIAPGSTAMPSASRILAIWPWICCSSRRLRLNCRQRDSTVTGSFCGSVVASRNFTCAGGSSSVFSSALNADFDSMCTSSIR